MLGRTALIFSTKKIKWYHENYEISWRFWFIDKRCCWTVENKIKEQKGRFLGMLAATLGANLLENMLAGKVALRTGEGEIRVLWKWI